MMFAVSSALHDLRVIKSLAKAIDCVESQRPRSERDSERRPIEREAKHRDERDREIKRGREREREKDRGKDRGRDNDRDRRDRGGGNRHRPAEGKVDLRDLRFKGRPIDLDKLIPGSSSQVRSPNDSTKKRPLSPASRERSQSKQRESEEGEVHSSDDEHAPPSKKPRWADEGDDSEDDVRSKSAKDNGAAQKKKWSDSESEERAEPLQGPSGPSLGDAASYSLPEVDDIDAMPRSIEDKNNSAPPSSILILEDIIAETPIVAHAKRTSPFSPFCFLVLFLLSPRILISWWYTRLPLRQRIQTNRSAWKRNLRNRLQGQGALDWPDVCA